CSSSSCAMCHGEGESEPRSAAFFRTDPDPPSHRRHEPLRDEEAETGSRLILGRAIELVEDPSELRVGYPAALVGDGHLDRIGTRTGLDPYDGAGRRVLDRVLDELTHDLAELVGIGPHRRHVLVEVDDEAVAVR